MTAAVSIHIPSFSDRLERIRSLWENEKSGEALVGCDALLVGLGEPSEVSVYQKSTAIFSWLLGYEFPETIMAITKDSVSFLTSVRKASILKQLTEQLPGQKIQVFGRDKDLGKATPIFEEFWASFSGDMTDGPLKVGKFLKDKTEGPLYQEWANFLSTKESIEVIDVASSASTLLALKDEIELESSQFAGRTSAVLMEGYVATKVLSIIDEGKKMSHVQLSETIESHINDQLGRYKSKLPGQLQSDQVDVCYPPIIQSGGIFSLKPSAVSSDEPLHSSGAIMCSLGIRYKSYCSNIARTFLVNPTKTQEEELVLLIDLQKYLIDRMKPGVALSDVYNAGVEYVHKHRPDVEKNLPNNFGFSMGLEFREPEWVINAKNTKTLHSGMIINLVLGLQGLRNEESKNPKEQSYGLLLSDTVKIGQDSAEIITVCLNTLKDLSYTFKKGPSNRASSAATVPAGGIITRTRLRNNQADLEAEKKRKEHQKELMLAATKEALLKYSQTEDEQKLKIEADKKNQIQRVESYKKESAFPRDLCKDWKIVVDKRNETIILPIQGFAVPFHISTVKNVTKNDEGDFVSLRINFNTPGRTAFGKKDSTNATPAFETPMAEFIRGVVFRSSDAGRVQETFKEIQDLRKSVTERELARKEMSDLVEQAQLVEVTGKRPARLVDVYLRPTLESRRAPGDVEIHQNGLRFRTQLKADQRVDVLFSNIKHFFFQPCDHESVVILHVHLHHPIMVGKKKTKDIQFYREAIDSLVDETSGRRTRMRFGDEDEIAQEQEERKRRAEANAEFKSFAERVTEQSKTIDVDVPFRDLGFSGIYTKHNVMFQPTTDCLVQLTEPPFLVVPLGEVEIAYLERVMFGLKNFDLVFVMKDHSKPVVAINSIPIGSIQAVKEWLDSVDVVFAESKINFNWANVLKTIKEDPIDFYENGGWASLQPDENGDSDEDDEDEQSSAYEPEDSDEEAAEESEEEDESEFSESEEDESDFSESEEEEEEEESDSPDWDELERRAAREDARRESAVGAGSKRKAPPAKAPIKGKTSRR